MSSEKRSRVSPEPDGETLKVVKEKRKKVLEDDDYFIKTYSGKVLKYAELMEKAIEKAKADGESYRESKSEQEKKNR